MELRFTLIADGSSDATLLHIIKWVLDNRYPRVTNSGELADFRRFREPPKSLADKVLYARKYYPFNVLFIHRDAESIDPVTITKRINEVKRELSEEDLAQTVCIVPVKMMETWLLIDAKAIKKAAGNRNYTKAIQLPAIGQLEKEQQPKERLHELLKEVSGRKGRSLDKFNVAKAVHLVAENIEDYSSLRGLHAFKNFEDNLVTIVNEWLSKNTEDLKSSFSGARTSPGTKSK